MSQLYLGIDVGTYSSKGVLVDLEGKIIKSHVVEHTMDIPQPGWAEQNADQVWWNDVVKICNALIDGSPFKGGDVRAIGLSAIGPCVLPLDVNGQPLRPGILYGVDTRANKEINYFNETYGEDEIFKFSGMALSSQAAGPKILWIKNNEPEIWKSTRYIMTASSYLVYKLTGEKVIDKHTASHYMPFIDISSIEWSDKFSKELEIMSKFPHLGWSDEIAGYVHLQASKQTGLKVGTPVSIGAVDALSEAVSVGVIEPGDLMIMYGSTTFFINVIDKPNFDNRLWTVGGAFKGQYNLAAGMATTGSLTRWFRDELATDLSEDIAYSELFSEAEKIQPGSEGIMILPYFSGERTPINDPFARGLIIGLTLAHRRKHLFRALLESVAFGIKHNLDTFNSLGSEISKIVAVGGGTKSIEWIRIVSDVSGVPQIVPEITVGASFGDAFLAAIAVGDIKMKDINQWVNPKEVIYPDEKRNIIYQDLYPIYLELYKRNKDLMHFLAKSR